MEGFGSSGIRGVALEELTPRYALDIARAAGSYFRESHERVAVGRDTRTTGRLLVDAVASGLASVGCNVDRVGVVPTPALQAYCERERTPGVMVTASHNPPEFNGIKLCDASGVGLQRETLDRIEERFEDNVDSVSWEEAGQSQSVDGVNREYREELLAAVDRERIADADLTVALDPGHGAGALTSPTFFRELGCSVETVNAQPDGRFPGRYPEPVAERLSDLQQLVTASDAAIGIAHDGDGDRAMFVDETGSVIDGDAVIAALAAAEVAAGEIIVSAVNCSQRLVDVAQNAEVGLHLTPIGSTYITTAIQKLQAEGRTVPIAGEGNGGIIYPSYRIARDGAYTATRLLELVVDRSASEVVAPYDGYHSIRESIPYGDADERQEMIDAVKAYALSADAEPDTIDGYRLDYGDGWVLARPSGTEPVLRVYAEARDPKRAEELLDEMVSAVRSDR